jgi:hypothetical protein
MAASHNQIVEKSYRDQIAGINAHIVSLTNEKKELEEKLLEHIKNTNEHVYVIYANPSDTHHVAHNVGCFSTELQAQKFIPQSGYSYDSEDNVKWYYSVQKKEVGYVSERVLMTMDRSPPNFPYCGW